MKSLFAFKFFLFLVLGSIHTSYSQSVLYVTSLADNGTGTLRQQITNAFPGDTIKFQVTGTIYLANMLSVSKEIVIIGPGVSNLTISHGGGYSFYSSSMLTLTDDVYISDLKILGSAPNNTYAPGLTAGAVGKVVKIKNILFENCRRIPIAGVTSGGALQAIGDSVIIDQCQFINNQSLSPQNTANGGAVYTYGIHTFITNCTFTGNSAFGQANPTNGNLDAYGYGGAIISWGLPNGNIIIDNCAFENNTITGFCTYQAGGSYGEGYGYGGAININTSNSFQNVKITNSSFINNTASGIGSSTYNYSYGGAINLNNLSNAVDTIELSNLVFDGNKATGVNSYSGYGAIFSKYGFLKMKNCQIKNTVSNNEAVRVDWCYVDIENSSFSNNSSPSLGIVGFKNQIIRNCLFENNLNSAIRLTTGTDPNKTATIINTTFSNNSSTEGSALRIVSCAEMVNIQNCTMMDNTVTVAGKAIAIYAYNSPNINLKNNIISIPTFSSNPLIALSGSTILSGGGNIVRDASAAVYLNQINDMNSANPNLGTYGNNGGPTKTYSLLSNSPAINIDPTASLAIDQRGFNRDNQTDAGAFEFGASNPNMPVILSSLNDTTICAEENINISIVTNSIPNDPIQYEWKLNGTVMAGETNATVNFTPLTSGVYTFSCTAFNSSDSAISNNIIVTVLDLPNISASPDETLCAEASTTISATGGVSYTWDNGLGTGSSHSVSPANTTTYTVTGGDGNGCKNTDQVVVTVLPVPVSNICQSACGTYTWTSGNGQTYTSSTTATHTIVGGAANGCDSTITLNLTINQPASHTINQTACGTYTWTSGNGQTYNSSTTATHTFPNGAANGCDSIVTLNLTINQPASHTINQTACGTYTWTSGNGQTYTSSTTATHTILGGAANGCDSTVTLNLTINQPASHTINQTACGTYTWTSGNGQTYTSSTTATHTILGGAANGCDSIVTLNLTINQPITHTENASACGSYTWTNGDGQTYASSTTASHTFPNGAANGCDSIVTLNLTISQPITHTENISSCGSYTWTNGNGQTYTSSTTASHTFPNGAANGCDSIVTLNLTINQATSSTLNITNCGAYTLNGQTYTSSGTYTQSLINANNCDSIITLNLTVNNVDNTVSVNGITLTANQTGGTYQWIDCDNGNTPISSETSQSFTPAINGNYAVELTANGCTETSVCNLINSVGIEELLENGWSVYPNPGNGVFTISSKQELSHATIEVYSALGQLIYSGIHSGEKIIIDLKDEPTGVYVLKVNNQQNFRVVKF